MPIFDLICADCKTKLGEIDHPELPPHGVEAHMCKDCFLSKDEQSEWLHVEQNPKNMHHMAPVSSMVVVARNILEHVNRDVDVVLTASLCHHDLRDDILPMLMGNVVRKMQDGRVCFDGLYVRGTGCFRFRFDSPGYEPVFTGEFRVT